MLNVVEIETRKKTSQSVALANPKDLRMTADVRMEPHTTDVNCKFKFY